MNLAPRLLTSVVLNFMRPCATSVLLPLRVSLTSGSSPIPTLYTIPHSTAPSYPLRSVPSQPLSFSFLSARRPSRAILAVYLKLPLPTVVQVILGDSHQLSQAFALPMELASYPSTRAVWLLRSIRPHPHYERKLYSTIITLKYYLKDYLHRSVRL